MSEISPHETQNFCVLKTLFTYVCSCSFNSRSSVHAEFLIRHVGKQRTDISPPPNNHFTITEHSGLWQSWAKNILCFVLLCFNFNLITILVCFCFNFVLKRFLVSFVFILVFIFNNINKLKINTKKIRKNAMVLLGHHTRVTMSTSARKGTRWCR